MAGFLPFRELAADSLSEAMHPMVEKYVLDEIWRFWSPQCIYWRTKELFQKQYLAGRVEGPEVADDSKETVSLDTWTALQIGTHSGCDRMDKTCASPGQTRPQCGEGSWHEVPPLRVILNCWEREGQFSLRVETDKSTMP